MALRELAGTEDIDALRVFASTLQPVPFGDRYRGQHTSQLTPMDLLVDAVRPDPPSRHEMPLLVKEYLKSPKGAGAAGTQLNEMFARWSAAVPVIQQQMSHAPLLARSRPRLDQFAQLASAGQQAMGYLGGKKAPAGWKQSRLAEIETARKNEGLVRFTVLDALHDLVSAVQNKSLPPGTTNENSCCGALSAFPATWPIRYAWVERSVSHNSTR